MCRLFGFRASSASPVHRSLLREGNALLVQSHEHKDGWGIGWWSDSRLLPELERGAGAAFAEADFARVARMVSAPAVLAHIRAASVGNVRLHNSHPFRHGRWLFAHNGTLVRFAEVRAAIEERIDPDLRALLAGDTDSERCFYLFLTRLRRRAALEGAGFEDAAAALGETVAIVQALTDREGEPGSATTFLVGNGELMLAVRRGRTLFFSTHKQRCPERGTCARFRAACESPARDLPVNHLIIASERLSTEDVWEEVPEEWLVGIDESLRVHRRELAPLLVLPRAA